MTTRLFLIRHGATQLTMEDRFSGAANIYLSEEGRAQADRLALRLADDNIAAIYTSPLDRTMETAAIIARPHGLTPIQNDGLREISHGHWEGMSRKEVEENFHDEYMSWESDPFTFAPEGGESGISVLARALPVIRQIVVTHKDRDRLDQAPACLNILDFRDAVHARLMLFNDVSHYADHPHRPQKHLSRWWDVSNDAKIGTE
jgi:probable phosphoglycerate mutase